MGTGVFGAFDAGARGTLPDFFCGTLEAGRFLSAIGFRRTLFAFRPSLGARMIDIQANFSIVVVLGACIAPLGPSKCILLYANSRAETNSEQRKVNSGCYANSPPSPCRSRNSFGGPPDAVRGGAWRDVHAARRDLGLGLVAQHLSPNPGQSLDSLGGDAEIATGADEHFFQPPDEFHRPKQ